MRRIIGIVFLLILVQFSMNGRGLELTFPPTKFSINLYITDLGLNITSGKLYVIGNSSGRPKKGYLYVYELDKNYLPTGSFSKFKIGKNPISLAIEPLRRKIYIISSHSFNNLYVFDLDEGGNPVGNPKIYNVGTQPMALVLDPVRKKLYIADNGNKTSNLYVYDLDDEGNPRGDFRSYPSGTELRALALDPVRNKLYVGRKDYSRESHDLEVYTLDNQGNPITSPKRFTVAIWCDSLALDTFRNKLYIANRFLSDFTLFVYELDSEGNPVNVPISYPGPWYPISLFLDTTGRELFIGGASNDFYLYHLDEKGNPEGSPFVFPIRGFISFVSDRIHNKLYVAKREGLSDNLFVYDMNKTFLRGVSIDEGKEAIRKRTITLNIPISMARWIYVRGDVESVGFPIYKRGQWVSTGVWGKDRDKARKVSSWKVPVVMKGGLGKKVIRIGFLGGPKSGATIFREELVTIF